MKSDRLTNHFLIAMPNLEDPNFSRTVTYICEHNDDGAMGLIINRPLEITLADIFAQMELSSDSSIASLNPVYQGGPVQQELGFVLHHPASRWEATLTITDSLALTTSRDILTAMANGSGPEDSLTALGYAGWGAGQLEEEMAENAWLSGPADPAILFNAPFQERWRLAAASLGVDLAMLSGDIGHA